MIPSVLLCILGVLGAFDVAYFHHYRCRLGRRPECRAEIVTHVARGFMYAVQFALVPNLYLGGRWYYAAILFFAADAAIAIADVALEPASREKQGGLPRGEYVMHIVLSVLVGAYIALWFQGTASWMGEPTRVEWAPNEAVPPILRVLLYGMAVVSAVVAVVEASLLLDSILGRPRPVHVRLRVRAPLEELWKLTQDHHLHPTWDHRFSRIVMLGGEITTGTSMLYEKTICGVTIRGTGRYKLHRPMKQSTFEFASGNPLSLIEEGVGLWLYRPQSSGWVEFSTSYDYAVRFGVAGRLIDRALFRPWIQRETERSFVRLGRLFFSGRHSGVLGRQGRKPRRFGGGAPSEASERKVMPVYVTTHG